MSALLQFSNYLEQPQPPPPYEAPPEGSWSREQPTEQRKPPRLDDLVARHAYYLYVGEYASESAMRLWEEAVDAFNKGDVILRHLEEYLFPRLGSSNLGRSLREAADTHSAIKHLESVYAICRSPREADAHSATKDLEGVYVIDNRPAVAAFIEANRLRSLLLQARNPLNAAFGEESIKTLTLVHDDEGFTTLFCLVMVSGDMQEARRALKSFDQQWWLARSEQAAGKLNFDFELI